MASDYPSIKRRSGRRSPGDSHYDQVAYVPSHTGEDLTGRGGVFDFDSVLFRELWEARDERDFDAYTRWAMSDHGRCGSNWRSDEPACASLDCEHAPSR